MSATAKIAGGVALIAVGAVLGYTPFGAPLVSTGVGLAPGGRVDRPPPGRGRRP